jgi:hypothetical protein
MANSVAPVSLLPDVVTDFESISNVGFEQATSDDFAIPLLRILDTKSPQVNKRDDAYVKGAEPGDIYNSVMDDVYKGESGMFVIPCYYSRRYVEWVPRDSGGGYVGSYEADDPIVKTAVRDPDTNKDKLPNGNELANTAQFYVVILNVHDDDYSTERAMIPMSSTQLIKSRKWMSQMQAKTAKNKKGGLYVLPIMSQVYKLTTVPEKNAKGDWFGWVINHERGLDLKVNEDKELFNYCFSFHKSVAAGEIKVKDQSTNDEIPFDDEVM